MVRIHVVKSLRPCLVFQFDSSIDGGADGMEGAASGTRDYPMKSLDGSPAALGVR